MNNNLKLTDHLLSLIHLVLSKEMPDLTKEDLITVFEGKDFSKDPPLTRNEAAERLKVSLPTIARWLADGTVKSSKIAGTVRISEAEIQRLLTPRAA
jgi:excisionase family DNA binding protein